MPIVLSTSVSSSGNLVIAKKFQGSKKSSNLFENNNTNDDIEMTKDVINNENISSMEYIDDFKIFNERTTTSTYDDYKSSYQSSYNNNIFTNHNNINKNVTTEKNANEILNLKKKNIKNNNTNNNNNLISINDFSTSLSSTTNSFLSSFPPSLLSTSPSSSSYTTTSSSSSIVDNKLNDNINMQQHITTTSTTSNKINTFKKSFTTNGSVRWAQVDVDNNNNNNHHSEIFPKSATSVTTTKTTTTTSTVANIYNNNNNNPHSKSRKSLSALSDILGSSSTSNNNKPQFKSNDVDRVDRVIVPDDITKSRYLRKQPSPSKIQRLKRTFSLTKKTDKEEDTEGEEEQEQEQEQQEIEIINTSDIHDNPFALFATITTPPLDFSSSNSFTMSRGSSIVKNDNSIDENMCENKPSILQQRLGRSKTIKKSNSNDTTTTTTSSTITINNNNNDSKCNCNNKSGRKRVKSKSKSNSIHRCPFLSSTSSSIVENSVEYSNIGGGSTPNTPSSSSSSSPSPTSSSSSSSSSSTSSSVSSSNFVCDVITTVPESREKSLIRNSMEDQTEFDIRRSWSHIEVRHFKGLFKRNRHLSDVQRRNSYAYTNSTKTNQQMVSDSEYNVINRVNNANNDGDDSSTTSSDADQPSSKKFPVDIFALQADMEKETDVITRSRQMRKFIISEIYSTEQSYLSHMRTLKKTFMDPCVSSSTTSPLINKDDVKTIFAHLDDLIKLSDTIVETIETSMDPREVYDSKLGHVFLKFAKEFGVYKKYAENIQTSRQLLSKKVNQSVFYRKFVSSQRKKENIKLGLNDYMIMPIQRVARYSLLLRELKKYTSETHSDYNDLNKALDYMISLAIECNNNIRDI